MPSRFAPEPSFRHDQSARTGILLCNLGTPDAPTAAAVRPYLAQFLSDDRVVEIPKLVWWPILHGIILRTRPAKSAAKYATVWHEKDGSPLLHWTTRQATLLRLATRLRSPQPPVRSVRVEPVAGKTVHTDAPTGSAYVLQLPSGHRGALVIVGFKDLGHSLDPVFSVAQWRGGGDEVPPLAHLAQLGTLRMPSFLKSHAHVGIIPPDGPQGFMSRLQPVGVVPQPWPFDPADAIWLSIGRLAREVDRQLAGQAAGGVS